MFPNNEIYDEVITELNDYQNMNKEKQNKLRNKKKKEIKIKQKVKPKRRVNSFCTPLVRFILLLLIFVQHETNPIDRIN